MKNKKILLYILVAIISLFLMNLFHESEEMKLDDLEDIRMSIVEGTLSRSSATILITDFSNQHNVYGKWYRIDKKVNRRWRPLKNESSWNNLIGYFVDENHQLRLTIDWEYDYGKLENGTYRLVKEVNGKYFAVEFTIQ